MNPDRESGAATARNSPSANDMRVYAGRLLAKREYAVLELQSRLLRKWAGVPHIDGRVAELIENLKQEGVLSDQRFVESFIRSRRRRYNGPVKIRSELRQRQVPDGVIAQQLLPSEGAWTELASAWLSQQCQGPLDFSARARYYRRLMNRGFSHQQAMEALNSREKA